jgi:N-acetyl-gamma-glutamyl-phosphate/LysW-gamma-L-alpha-aminoadipyl-6-phosphate reductase
VRVALIGAAGYVGGELLRILLQHPEVRECVATSRSQAGKPVSSVHPSLALLTEARFSGASAAEAGRHADVVFLALEHGQSSQLMGELIDAGPGLVVDLSADFRIQDGRLHERYYGSHPAAELVHRFRYALADVLGTRLRGATALAAPGCFATAAQLALYPLAEVGLAAPPVIFAVTGSSGAGVHPKATTHHPARAHNLFAYSVGGHRHEGEILEQWRGWTGDPGRGARLLAHSGPFVRGIYATLHASLAAPVEPAVMTERFRAAYAGRPFVRLLDQPPELTHAVGTNLALLHVAVAEAGREVQVMVAVDNLIKGAGGQAVQAMNLALGLEETAGLKLAGAFPC